MAPPATPKLYHIVHVDRLASILADGCLWCDAEVERRPAEGTTIGMGTIKQRRLQLTLRSQPGLHVGKSGRIPDRAQPALDPAALGALEGLQVTIYEPSGTPDPVAMVHSPKVPKMTAGRAALVELMHRYLTGLLDPFVTLLEVHKLMYFMQEAGEPLRLSYTKGPYGPYAENLRHVLRAIEGHLILGYADGGDAPDKPLSLVRGAVEEAAAFLAHHADTRARFGRVARLVEGFESPFGLELLATVHWAMTREGGAGVDEVTRLTYAWGERKRQFTPRQIGIAYDALATNGWTQPVAEGLPAPGAGG